MNFRDAYAFMSPLNYTYDAPDSAYQSYLYYNAPTTYNGVPQGVREAQWKLHFPNDTEPKILPFSTNVNSYAFKLAYENVRDTEYEEWKIRNNGKNPQ